MKEEDDGDVQRKITPWNKSQEILSELFPGAIQHSLEKKRQSEAAAGLVLVASLVQKPPNLGGIIVMIQPSKLLFFVVCNQLTINCAEFSLCY